MTFSAIHIENVTKTYQDSTEPAVDHLSLSVKKGAIFGLLGPNGAGKTTTISMVSGLLKPDSGTVKLFGKRLGTGTLQKCGTVPQEIALYDHLSAMENLIFFGKMYGLRNANIRAGAVKYLRELGLYERRNDKIKHYSGGMKRRVNLIAALLHRPQLLILDEPTVGIDVQSKKVIIEKLETLNQQGVTILYTSHHMDEAERFCTEIAIIDHGKILISGSPERLLAMHSDCANLEDLFIKLTGRQLRD